MATSNRFGVSQHTIAAATATSLVPVAYSSPPSLHSAPTHPWSVSIATSSVPKQTSKTKKTRSHKGPPRAPVLTALFPKEPTDRSRFQFVRVETYAIQGVASKTKGGALQKSKASIVQILDEALRATEEGCKHLIKQKIEPKPPRFLYGPGMKELFIWYESHKQRAAENSTPYVSKRTGRVSARRQDRRWPTVLAEVASFPGPPNDADGQYVQWRELCVARLKRIYGEKLVSVIEHIDEPHGHIHALVAHPDATPVRAMHPGHRESDARKAQGYTSKQQQAAYKAGLEDFQSDFHSLVGYPAGLKRISPQPHARHSYQQARANKQAAAEYAERVGKLLEREKQLVELASTLTASLVQRQVQIEVDAETAMQRAFRRASELAEAKYAQRAQELVEEGARLGEERKKLDVEVAALTKLTEHVRRMQARERARYEGLLAVVQGETDVDTFDRIVRAALNDDQLKREGRRSL
jgi:hypothetical protein